MFVISMIVMMWKTIVLMYKIFRYGQIFSLREFMFAVSCSSFMVPFGIRAVDSILSKEIKFDNNIPAEYLHNKIMTSKSIQFIRALHHIGFLIMIIKKRYLGFIHVPHHIFFNVLHLMLLTSGILFGIFCMPFGLFLLDNVYRIFTMVKINSFFDIFYMILAIGFLFVPFAGLEMHKHIIQYKLFFDDDFDKYFDRNIKNNKSFHLGFYSYGFMLIFFTILVKTNWMHVFHMDYWIERLWF